MTTFGLPLQRYLLAALAALVAIVFWSATTDPTTLPKATLAAGIAIALVAISLVRIAVFQRVVVLRGPLIWATGALGAGLVLATITSDVPGVSIPGVLGRSDGLLLYGASLVSFVLVLRAYDAATLPVLAYGLLVGGAFLASYGLFQAAGIDAIRWADVGISPIIGTLGNPDFEAAYVGIMLPLAAWGALTRSWATPWRIASALLLLACLAVAAASSSSQGLLAGAAGLVIVAIALLLARGDRLSKLMLVALGVGATAFAAVLTLGILAGIGPGERVVAAGSLTARKWYWASALDLWQANPLTGVGLDRYGAYYRTVRPAEAVAASNFSDSAHNVPLHLLATGGLFTAVPYLVVVALVGWALLSGLRRLAGEQRLLLAAFGGAWVAYQVQSLVSIDHPALAVTHWLVAGGVVVLAAPPRRTERLLPGAVVARERRGRAPVPTDPQPNWSGASIALTAIVTVGALLVSWQALEPLRADHAARSGAEELAAGRGNAALDRLDKATDLAPAVAGYWLGKGRFLEQVQQQQLAAAAYSAGIARDPRSYDLLLASAVLAKQMGDTSAVQRRSAQLAQVDPSGAWRPALAG